MDLKGLAVVAPTVACFASDIDRRKKVHFNFEHSVALALFAPPALDIETESARIVTAHAGGWQTRKKVPDMVEHAGVSSRVTARSAANGRLIDHDHLVQRFFAFNRPMRAGTFLGPKPMAK